jgi:UDPglucose 6-dehydrogenase
MKNKIVIVGTGYVGLVTGTCFSEMGNQVICVDIDQTKIENLKKGIIPIFEPGLEQLVLNNYKNGNLNFTTNLANVIDEASIVFIAVGTPMGEDGSADLQYVLSVAKEIGQLMKNPLVVVDKSTVPVGTADKVKKTIQNELDKRGLKIPFEVVSNPEFLKEGDAINDFMKPDRVVIGAETDQAIDMLRKLYDPFLQYDNQFISMDVRSAEMTKYAANAMLATKISFMNEIANICELVGADVNMVKNGIGSDKRIGYSFINPGCGYGGSCFPKDVQALNKIALENGYQPALIQAVEKVNDNQKLVIANKVLKRYGYDLSGKTFTVWGLAFKPGTDDMREAPAIYIINELIKRGAKINAYDPKAMHEAQIHYLKENDKISYFDNKYDSLNKSNGLLLLTEWKEFRSPDFEEIKKRLINPVIFDGRNQYHNFKLKNKGFEYYQIGV